MKKKDEIVEEKKPEIYYIQVNNWPDSNKKPDEKIKLDICFKEFKLGLSKAPEESAVKDFLTRIFGTQFLLLALSSTYFPDHLIPYSSEIIRPKFTLLFSDQPSAHAFLIDILVTAAFIKNIPVVEVASSRLSEEHNTREPRPICDRRAVLYRFKLTREAIIPQNLFPFYRLYLLDEEINKIALFEFKIKTKEGKTVTIDFFSESAKRSVIKQVPHTIEKILGLLKLYSEKNQISGIEYRELLNNIKLIICSKQSFAALFNKQPPEHIQLYQEILTSLGRGETVIDILNQHLYPEVSNIVAGYLGCSL